MTLVVGAVLGLAAEWLPLRRLEWLAEDWRLAARERWAPVETSGEVVLLEIDQKALHVQGQWPFLRSVHGQLMEWLGKSAKARPAVLSWDFVFAEETFDPRLDLMFASPLKDAGYPIITGVFSDRAARGVLGRGLRPMESFGLTRALSVGADALATLPDQGGLMVPVEPLLEASKFALLDADPDEDGVVRRIPLVVRVGERVFASLTLQTLLDYWRVSAGEVEVRSGDAVVVKTSKGERRVPIDEQGYYTLNYRYELKALSRDRFGIESLSYQDAYEGVAGLAFGDQGEALPTAGRIVVVGQTAEGLSDLGPSPLRSKSGRVLVHLNALENILSGDYLRHVSVWPGVVVLLVLGLGLAGTLDERRGWYVVLLPFVLLAFACAAWALLVQFNVMMPLAVPAVAFIAQQVFVTTLKIREEQANRDRIRKMFGSYVSPELVRRMVEARAEPQLGGHEDEITAFFSDIQGFSAFSEVLRPADLVQLLNEYLGAMTDILQNRGGALDKYIGDAIVAMFGGLVPLKDHARRACEAAAAMQMKQAELRAKWKAQGERWPKLVHEMRTRIGLNSGVVVVGNMGSHHRFNYTMMGDAVNLAARCESGAKAFGAYVVVTGTTVQAAKAAGCACVFRELDRIVVKGRREPAEIFEIVALSPEHLPEGAARCLELFAEGRGHYLRQAWGEAIRCFEEAAKLEPLQPERDAGVDGNPSLVMLDRCRALRAQPPGAEWDGVYRMKTK